MSGASKSTKASGCTFFFSAKKKVPKKNSRLRLILSKSVLRPNPCHPNQPMPIFLVINGPLLQFFTFFQALSFGVDLGEAK
jgi:hypothetical protein